ncbi:MAG: hypothetical protein KQA41_03895 [Candidatus Aenigmarchaeota archaeon]|nr:hypothetical protein [Candidatus Aenigmarchaeota archaeon]
MNVIQKSILGIIALANALYGSGCSLESNMQRKYTEATNTSPIIIQTQQTPTYLQTPPYPTPFTPTVTPENFARDYLRTATATTTQTPTVTKEILSGKPQINYNTGEIKFGSLTGCLVIQKKVDEKIVYIILDKNGDPLTINFYPGKNQGVIDENGDFSAREYFDAAQQIANSFISEIEEIFELEDAGHGFRDTDLTFYYRSSLNIFQQRNYNQVCGKPNNITAEFSLVLRNFNNIYLPRITNDDKENLVVFFKGYIPSEKRDRILEYLNSKKYYLKRSKQEFTDCKFKNGVCYAVDFELDVWSWEDDKIRIELIPNYSVDRDDFKIIKIEIPEYILIICDKRFKH